MRERCKEDSHRAGDCPDHATAGAQRAIAPYVVALVLATAAWLVAGSALAHAPDAKPRSSLDVAVVALQSPYAGDKTDTVGAPIISDEDCQSPLRGGSVVSSAVKDSLITLGEHMDAAALSLSYGC